MTTRVLSPAGAAAPGSPSSAPSPAAAVRPSGSRFAELLAQRTAPTASGSTPPGGAFTEAGRQLLARVSRGEHQLEAIVRQAQSGAAFTPADLLAMQARVYRYTQELELFSKLVDRATSTVKTVLQQNG